MIQQLHDALLASAGPSRELDVLLHEVLTGELDCQPAVWREDGVACCREISREHGEIVVDRGSEQRRISVPHYTANLGDIIELKDRAETLVLVVSDGTPPRWTMSLWDKREAREPERLAELVFEGNPANGLCLLLVRRRMCKR